MIRVAPFFMIMLTSVSCTSLRGSKNGLTAVWNLDSMAKCELGVTAYKYDDYGCYCGYGGEGTPVDGIDE